MRRGKVGGRVLGTGISDLHGDDGGKKERGRREVRHFTLPLSASSEHFGFSHTTNPFRNATDLFAMPLAFTTHRTAATRPFSSKLPRHV
jgi:hypothetical protein